MTAVEWLQEALEDTILTKEQIMQTIGLFEQAKEMEKEQSYTYDEIRTIAYNAYCLGQLDEPTEGKYNLWIQQFKKKTQAKSYQDKMKEKVKQARVNAKLIK